MASTKTGGNLAHGTVTCTNSATLIRPEKPGRVSLLVQAIAAVTIGGASVTTANGINLAVGETYRFEDYAGPVYGVAAASAEVRFLEVT